MRFAVPLILLFPTVSLAQTKEMVEAIERKLANQRTAKWVLALEAPEGGFYLAPQDPKSDSAPRPMLRATNGAVRALKYLGFPLLKTEKEKHAAFVLKCFDPATGAFAEPGGKPDVAITSIGVMAAAELGIPREKFAKAMEYLKENAKTFEEVRIAAAALEALGEKPEWVKAWFKIQNDEINKSPIDAAQDGGARVVGSHAAMKLRLGEPITAPLQSLTATGFILAGQRGDGGWSKPGEKTSDIESTYRVMRALMLMKKLRAFVDSHRNEDGGYATKTGDKSSMSGVYYSAIITHWLDEMEKK